MFLPLVLLGLGGILPLGRLAGSLMMEQVMEVRLNVGSDLQVEVVEALMKCFER